MSAQTKVFMRALGALGCLGGSALVCGGVTGFLVVWEAFFLIFVGWVAYLGRVVPEIAVDWVSRLSASRACRPSRNCACSA